MLFTIACKSIWLCDEIDVDKELQVIDLYVLPLFSQFKAKL